MNVENVDSRTIDISIATGFNRRRLPHQEIRVGATDGGKHRGRLKGETTVSHVVMCMCVRGWGGVEWGKGKGVSIANTSFISSVLLSTDSLLLFLKQWISAMMPFRSQAKTALSW